MCSASAEDSGGFYSLMVETEPSPPVNLPLFGFLAQLLRHRPPQEGEGERQPVFLQGKQYFTIKSEAAPASLHGLPRPFSFCETESGVAQAGHKPPVLPRVTWDC